MRVLHFLWDYKWTGPAEPTVALCRALLARGLDVALLAAAPRAGAWPNLVERATAAGVPLRTDLRLSAGVWNALREGDLRALRRLAGALDVDLIHVHSARPHWLAGLARATGKLDCAIVRTNHTGVPIPATIPNRIAFRRFTNGLVELSESARRADIDHLGLDPAHVVRVEGAVDLERFDPDRVTGHLRGPLGIEPDAPVVGVVARVQRHRRFEVLLAAIRLAADRRPDLRALVIGRGTHLEEVAVAPARAMGLAGTVIFTGYRRDDYVEALNTLDAAILLVPGSDGGCRAVREAMALGKPVIVARRGMLPEIVRDGVDGLVVDDAPQPLAEAILALVMDPVRREAMGKAARERAAAEFRIENQAARVAALYAEVTA
jgi:glycosyltransferase involved in cell wall biosynthesis